MKFSGLCHATWDLLYYSASKRGRGMAGYKFGEASKYAKDIFMSKETSTLYGKERWNQCDEKRARRY